MDSVDAPSEEQQKIIVLNQRPYRIERSVGSGHVAVAYKAVSLDTAADVHVIIKQLDPALADPEKINGLRREADVLRTLNAAEHGKPEDMKRIIAMLDSGNLPSGLPFVIQEVAPGKIFSPFEIKSFIDERQMLAVAAAVAEAMSLAHQHQLAFKDFDPEQKHDRIFLQWLSEGHDTFKMRVIDWNITGGPEDIAQDLIYLGCYLYYLFTGEHLKLVDNKPNLDVLQGQNAWQRISLGTRQIIQRLLNLDPTGVYNQANAAHDDLTRWHSLMMSAETTAPGLALQEAITNAQIQGHNEHAVAVADLALRLDVPSDKQAKIEELAKAPRQRLENKAMSSFSTPEYQVRYHSYERAIPLLDETLSKFTRDDPRARRARIIRLVAQAGYDIKTTSGHNPELWPSIESAVEALNKGSWEAAHDDLAKTAESWPMVEPLKKLQDWAGAGLKVEYALRQIDGASSPATGSITRWMQEEEAHLKTLDSATNLLEQAAKSAPDEPEFRRQYKVQRDTFEQRQKVMSRYKAAEKLAGVAEQLVKKGQESETEEKWSVAAEHYRDAIATWKEAFDELAQIRDANPNAALTDWQVRWSSDQAEAKSRLELAEACAKAGQLLTQGDYEAALNHLSAAEQQHWQNNAKIMAFTRQAEDGVAHIKLARTRLNTIQDLLHSRDLEQLKQARTLVDELYKENGKPYRYPNALVEALSKASQSIGEMESTLHLLEDARRTYNTAKIKEYLEKLDRMGVGLTEEELAELRGADQQATEQNTLKPLMNKQPETLSALSVLIKNLSELENLPAARREKDRVLYDWHDRLRKRELSPDRPASISDLIDDIEGSIGLGIDLPPALDTQLKDSLTQARKAQKTVGPLYGWDGASLSWLDDPDLPTDKKQKKLAELTTSLDELERASDWPALEELIKSGRRELLSKIKDYDNKQIDSLSRRAKGVKPFSTDDLKAVHSDATSYLNLIRQIRDIPFTRLLNLLAALDGRIKAEEILSPLMEQLTAKEGALSTLNDPNKRQKFSEARYLVRENGDVPTDHINTLSDQLPTLAAWDEQSRAALDFQTKADYSDGIAQLRQLLDIASQFDQLHDLQALSEYVQEMKGRLLEKEKSLLVDLNQETEKARQALQTPHAGEKQDTHRYSHLFKQQQKVGDDDSKRASERKHAELIDNKLSDGETALREFASFDQLRSTRDELATADELIRLGQSVRNVNATPPLSGPSPASLQNQQTKLDQFKSPVDQLISLFEEPFNRAKVNDVLTIPAKDPLTFLEGLHDDLKSLLSIDIDLAKIEGKLNNPSGDEDRLNAQQMEIDELNARITRIRPGSEGSANWAMERLRPWRDDLAERAAALQNKIRHQRAKFLFGDDTKAEEHVRLYLGPELDAERDKEAAEFIKWAIDDVTADPDQRVKLMSIVVRTLGPTPPQKGESRFRAWLSGLRWPNISIPRLSRSHDSTPASRPTSRQHPPDGKADRPPQRGDSGETSPNAKQTERDQAIGKPDNTQEGEK